MTNTITEWDFESKNVQPIENVNNFLSSESIVICSGPPELTDLKLPEKLIPIGLVQNAQVSQSKQINQIFEIGSRKPIFIPGRTLINVQISKILFDGASLMKALYLQDNSGNPPKFDENKLGSPAAKSPGNFYINLASKFFNKPFGLGFFLRDMEDDAYGGFYLNNCFVQNHTFGLSAQQTVLVENVAIRCSKLEPIAYELP